jgi:hypothetical protein
MIKIAILIFVSLVFANFSSPSGIELKKMITMLEPSRLRT